MTKSAAREPGDFQFNLLGNEHQIGRKTIKEELINFIKLSWKMSPKSAEDN